MLPGDSEFVIVSLTFLWPAARERAGLEFKSEFCSSREWIGVSQPACPLRCGAHRCLRHRRFAMFPLRGYNAAPDCLAGTSRPKWPRAEPFRDMESPSDGLEETAVKSQGEIEAAVCDGINRFELEYMGRGPKHVRAHLIGDLLVVRLQGVLTAAEQHLVQTVPPEKGRDLLKQVRTQLIETARPCLGKHARSGDHRDRPDQPAS